MRLELSEPRPTSESERAIATVSESLSRESWQGLLVAIAGLGNIGSPLALLLGRSLSPLGVRLRLFDRDVVERKNFINQQFHSDEDIGRPKVEVVANLIRSACPEANLDPRHIDLDDTTLDDFAGADLCVAGLDSLRARQCLINERAWPLNIPVIDGGVGEPALGRVQVFIPGSACLECSWSQVSYRQLAREYPCEPGRRAQGPPTNVPAFVGATVASIIAAESWKFLSGQRAAESFEIAFDLDSRRFTTGRLSRASGCRFHHQLRSGQ